MDLIHKKNPIGFYIGPVSYTHLDVYKRQILLITHELEKVLAHANRLVIMHKGKLVEDGKPEDVIYRSENYGVRMPLNDGQKVAALTWLK